MEWKYSMKRAAVIVGVLALVSISALAQEKRSEMSVQGTGFFTKDTDGNGIRQHATDTGGFLVGYRYNFNRWLAAEADRTAIRRFISAGPGSRRVQNPPDHWLSCGETAERCRSSRMR